MNEITVSKEEALAAYGGNQAALGRALGVTRQAVHALPSGPLPERYALKLRFVLKPEVFGDEAGGASEPETASVKGAA